MQKIKKINIQFVVLAAMVVIAGFSRLVVHIENFTPLGAMCIFGGAYFTDKWKACLTPLITLFLSDLVIQGVIYQGKYGFPLYEGWYWVYGTFAIIVLIGNYVVKHVSVVSIVLASSIAALTHWIITDFGVWLGGCNGLYTRDFNGFVLCYTMAIPYMLKFLMGTLFYSAIMFGVYELVKRRLPILESQTLPL